MCGIVGYIGKQDAAAILLDGLMRLEYRGYDSAGIAVLSEGRVVTRRVQGKLAKLQALLASSPLPSSSLGIGHTRWATHGRPSEVNAHPHSCGPITVVHNGIIENYAELRKSLQKKGNHFNSETDSEVLAHLIDRECDAKTSTLVALQKALKKVHGSYSIAVINAEDPEALYVARSGSPLVLGVGEEGSFVASDVPALLPYTRKIIILEDGEVAVLKSSKIEIENLSGKKITRRARQVTWSLAMAEKDGYQHFMLKEIFEQPRAIADTLRGRLSYDREAVILPALKDIYKTKQAINQIDKIYLVACGSSWHAALVGRFYLEKALGKPVWVEHASEFRYRNPIIDKNTLVVAISQSGETADTLVAVKNAKAKKAKIISITNVIDSSIARESHAVLYTQSGPEIGVAASKTFTSQLVMLLLFSIYLGAKKGSIKKEEIKILLSDFVKLPGKIESLLKKSDLIKKIALRYSYSDHCLFIGRGMQFPIALEGALKLKEISYLHAEGYPAGELKHGPIALIEQGSPLLAIVIKDDYYDKMVSNIQEVLSRQASVIALTSQGDHKIAEMVSDVIELPKLHVMLMPILSVVPLQLFAYYIADHKGHDVDQPRNLAKSVTVE